MVIEFALISSGSGEGLMMGYCAYGNKTAVDLMAKVLFEYVSDTCTDAVNFVTTDQH